MIGAILTAIISVVYAVIIITFVSNDTLSTLLIAIGLFIIIFTMSIIEKNNTHK